MSEHEYEYKLVSESVMEYRGDSSRLHESVSAINFEAQDGWRVVSVVYCARGEFACLMERKVSRQDSGQKES